MSSIVIVNTGCANLSSVKFAIQRLGFDASITDNHNEIRAASHVILPGVGSAQHAMANIREKQLNGVIQKLTQPVLGFCLGMQLMTEYSSESGMDGSNKDVECLGLIPTRVNPLQANGLRIPHMGWNTLSATKPHAILSDVDESSYVYFVHSYGAPISEYTIASTEYGEPFSAAISYKNFVGCQFHPERSSKVGAQIIKNFLTK